MWKKKTIFYRLHFLYDFRTLELMRFILWLFVLLLFIVLNPATADDVHVLPSHLKVILTVLYF